LLQFVATACWNSKPGELTRDELAGRPGSLYRALGWQAESVRQPRWSCVFAWLGLRVDYAARPYGAREPGCRGCSYPRKHESITRV